MKITHGASFGTQEFQQHSYQTPIFSYYFFQCAASTGWVFIPVIVILGAAWLTRAEVLDAHRLWPKFNTIDKIAILNNPALNEWRPVEAALFMYCHSIKLHFSGLYAPLLINMASKNHQPDSPRQNTR